MRDERSLEERDRRVRFLASIKCQSNISAERDPMDRCRTGSVRTDTGVRLAPFGQTPASDWLRSDRHRFRTGSVRTDTGAGLVRFEVKSASVE